MYPTSCLWPDELSVPTQLKPSPPTQASAKAGSGIRKPDIRPSTVPAVCSHQLVASSMVDTSSYEAERPRSRHQGRRDDFDQSDPV
ncbi:hypothetical protein VTH06DRAFT_6146 [Thermothelomyces fergusii]